jgi:N-acetylglucosaminyldiphosphoundecaprenol N-acetyl-beta-D-mannosaminyltransferase
MCLPLSLKVRRLSACTDMAMRTFSTETILEYHINTASCEGCIQQVNSWLEKRDHPRFFACANPHSLVVAARDPLYRNALLSADLLTPDGAGIVLASRILGGSIRDRITGTDVFVGVNKLLNDANGSVFFLGSTEQNLAAIRVKMSKEYPNISIAGTYSPPFKETFSSNDNELMI